MRTEDLEYTGYLKGNFLPGRRLYLQHMLYPRYMVEFPAGEEILDLGCGFGDFLIYCRKKGIAARGIDSNPHFVSQLAAQGVVAACDDICRLSTLPDGSVQAALADNVLEHLRPEEILSALRAIERKLAPGGCLLAVVPGKKGFARDQTHRTFLDEANIEPLSAQTGLVLENCFRYPLDWEAASRYWYLNMTLLKFRKSASAAGAQKKVSTP